MEKAPREVLKELIDIHRKIYFVKPEEVRDTEVLGVMINHYFDWDALDVLDVARTSLGDANLDEESKILMEKMNKLLDS